MNNEDIYVVFKVKNYIFSVPIGILFSIKLGDKNMSYTVIPNARKNVKCVMELDGQFVKIIQLPGIHEDISIIGSYIVMFEHSGKEDRQL